MREPVRTASTALQLAGFDEHPLGLLGRSFRCFGTIVFGDNDEKKKNFEFYGRVLSVYYDDVNEILALEVTSRHIDDTEFKSIDYIIDERRWAINDGTEFLTFHPSIEFF